VPEQDGEAPVAVFRHSLTVYEEMLSQATRVEVEGRAMMVYEGKLVELVTDTCGLAVPYYSKVTQALRGMGCCAQLRRGGGNTPSQWEVIRQPQPDLYERWLLSQAGEPEEAPEYVTMQQFNDLNRRLQVLEKAVGL